jgi:hypothetical protein
MAKMSDDGSTYQRGRDEVLRIDCDECTLDGTPACVDCVVTYLVDREPGRAVLVRPREVATLQLLAAGGLAPVLRHHPRTRCS